MIKVTVQSGQRKILVIDKVLPTKPITYKIVDSMGEEIAGSFHEQELQKAKQQTFRIAKSFETR